MIACSVSTLVVLAAMPTMGEGAGLAGHFPAATAAVVLVIFLVRAVIEASWAIRDRRGANALPIGHAAAAAGALSMVVMCTAMVAL